MTTNKVFVYGTLKKDEPNHHWLTDKDNGFGTFVSHGKTKTKYPLVIATKYNIPFLLHKPGIGHNVKGEVYEVDDKMFGKLDILEDHPNFYERERCHIVLIDRYGHDKPETALCWIYFLKHFKPALLETVYYENYSSSGSHGRPYAARSERDPNYQLKLDVKEP